VIPTPTLLELGLLPLPPQGDRFVVRAGPNVTRVRLRAAPDGEEELHELARGNDGFSRVHPQARARHYRFVIDLNDGRRLHLNAAGLHAHEPLDRFDFTTQKLGPAWARDAIFYQVFPDRFAVGDANLGVKDGAYQWRGHGARRLPFEHAPVAYREMRCLDFRGGDLPGVQQKLEHLQALGVNAIYLNPIHPAFTNHRYDVCDYEAVDPHLGGESALEALTAEAHRRGMRVILDAVINHCGSGHRWFNREDRYPEPGAYQDPASPFAEFFEFTSRSPVRYMGWKGIDTLPRLDFRSAKLRAALWGPQGALRKWLRAPFRVDGYRFDVANMVARAGEVQLHREVWRELSTALREEGAPYLVGEHWFDPHEIVGPELLHGAIDMFGFAFPLRRFFTGKDRDGSAAPLDGRVLARQLLDSHAASQGALHLVNVNNHDLARLQTAASPEAFRAATALQLFWPGAPSVYYGDEIGLPGGEDPDNRRSMIWDRSKWDEQAYAAVHGAIARRQGSKALREGALVGIDAGPDWAAFARVASNEVVIAVIARAACTLELPLERWGLPAFQRELAGPSCVVETHRL